MLKVFLIEDDEPLVALYKTAFELEGFAVEVAYDGQQAAQKLSSMVPKPDVILLDIMMPKMNGFDFLKSIKDQKDPRQVLPVVVISNLAQQPDIDKVMGLGADLYLVKSQHDPQQIVEQVKLVLFKR
ncbi:MAG TPA: response regulator transcription factor [Patescibacteria group bacterium]|jgi:DNA-binding response OmpR family regulator|nr:response regulator transcription factor [Patescibacteria group bacterium]